MSVLFVPEKWLMAFPETGPGFVSMGTFFCTLRTFCPLRRNSRGSLPRKKLPPVFGFPLRPLPHSCSRLHTDGERTDWAFHEQGVSNVSLTLAPSPFLCWAPLPFRLWDSPFACTLTTCAAPAPWGESRICGAIFAPPTSASCFPQPPSPSLGLRPSLGFAFRTHVLLFFFGVA